MHKHDNSECPFWIIEVLEETRRTAQAWELGDIAEGLSDLVEFSIRHFIADRTVMNYPAAIKALVFVALNDKSGSQYTRSERFRSARDEVLSALEDLSALCREYGEKRLANKIVSLARPVGESTRILAGTRPLRKTRMRNLVVVQTDKT